MEIVDYTPDGDPIYSPMPELPADWDMDDNDKWALYDEALASIGWTDCRW